MSMLEKAQEVHARGGDQALHEWFDSLSPEDRKVLFDDLTQSSEKFAEAVSQFRAAVIDAMCTLYPTMMRLITAYKDVLLQCADEWRKNHG